MTETIRKPLMSGHCASHIGHADLSEAQAASHSRCVNNGGGNRANPQREFQPCPCAHHYNLDADGNPAEVYECGGCGREIVEAWYWPLDEDGETRYTHIDGTGRALGEECVSAPVSRNPEPVEPATVDCVRCGNEFKPFLDSRVCMPCVKAAEMEAEAEDDFSDLDDEDDFADLADL